MTVKELIEELQKHPPDLHVHLVDEDGNFKYDPVNRVIRQDISIDIEYGLNDSIICIGD